MAKSSVKYGLYDAKRGFDVPGQFATLTRARRAICNYYNGSPRYARNLWIKNLKTGHIVGKVDVYIQDMSIIYVYTTVDSKERRINTDGTFVKKKVSSQYGIKGKLKPFGL